MDNIKIKNKGINRTKIFENVIYILIDYLVSSKFPMNIKDKLLVANTIAKNWNKIDVSGKIDISIINNLIDIYSSHINLSDVKEQCYKFQKCMEYIFKEFNRNKNVLPIKIPLNTKASRDEFIKFYQAYNEISFIKRNEFIRFQWPMSSGEYALFNMYCCLMDAIDNFFIEHENCNSVLLLLDEVNLYMHPEWQREYIFNLIAILKGCKKDISIQVILASHSPIILSDIPSQNVIYMSKGKNVTYDKIEYGSRTFAQNIYTLYTDSFFLGENDNIWIHGKFADEKLKEISTYLNDVMLKNTEPVNFKEIMKYYKTIIDIIGEDLIRSELLRKWSLAKIKFMGNENNISNIMNKIRCNEILNDFEKDILFDVLGIRG